ncbi:MAG: hypothetical protein QM504_14955 [Pseudomonadota bacterium]
MSTSNFEMSAFNLLPRPEIDTLQATEFKDLEQALHKALPYYVKPNRAFALLGEETDIAGESNSRWLIRIHHKKELKCELRAKNSQSKENPP